MDTQRIKNYNMSFNNIAFNLPNVSNYESGYLSIILGPMYAGKTSHLIKLFNLIKNNVIVISHLIDNRYDENFILSHDKKEKIPCLKYPSICKFIENEEKNFDKYKFILVDECQFFEDIVTVKQLVEKYNKNVYIFGLSGDFKRNKFGNVYELLPFCDEIKLLHSICSNCENKASFSHRLNNTSEQILVGSNDSYTPLCRSCYLIFNKKNDEKQ